MAKEMSTFDANSLPAELADFFDVEEIGDDLSGGVSGGFGVVSIRGSKWRIKSGGEEEPVVDDEGDPKSSLEVVIVKSNKHVSKIYYEHQYSEGDADEPDCFSLDGVKPDESAKNKQSLGCASCQWNQWGSRITDSGKKAKKCSDNRRVAVVPAGDIDNEIYGGPMLLRIPAASLGDLAAYGKRMAQKGYPYNAVVTRLGFDMDASYPKLTFKAVRALDKDELAKVAGHMQSEKLEAILSQSIEIQPQESEKEGSEQQPAQEQAAVDTDFEEEAGDNDEPAKAEQPPETSSGKTTKKKTSKKKTSKKKAAAKADTAEDDDDNDDDTDSEEEEESSASSSSANDELDDILNDLESLS